jgi:hypothetical protein
LKTFNSTADTIDRLVAQVKPTTEISIHNVGVILALRSLLM